MILFNVNVDDVAPVISVPFFFHWYVKLLPVAVTLIVTLPLTHPAIVAAGSVVITGAAFTVNTPLTDVMLLHVPVMITLY